MSGSINGVLSDNGGRLVINPGYQTSFYLVNNTAGLAAGNNDLAEFVVPAGSVYVVRNVCVTYTGTVAAVILKPYVLKSGVGSRIPIFNRRPAASGLSCDAQTDLVLQPTDRLNLFIAGATLNDSCEFSVLGYILNT